jgi:hypothetical protein
MVFQPGLSGNPLGRPPDDVPEGDLPAFDAPKLRKRAFNPRVPPSPPRSPSFAAFKILLIAVSNAF